MKKMVFSSIVLFLIALIPPSLGLFSYFRYEDFYTLSFVKLNMPDFSWASFLFNFQTKIYEYYRPVTHLSYWLGFLFAGNNATLLHGLASFFFALNSVLVYIIARHFDDDLSAWISTLLFTTFGPLVVISWWTGTFAIFPGLFIFLLAVITFLNIDRSPPLYTACFLFLISCSFLAKESFIILSPVFVFFYILGKPYRTGYHLISALSTIPLSLLKIWVSNSIMGSTVNSHVHLNFLEVDPLVIWGNLYDYWRLLIYGHNNWFVILALLGISPLVIKDTRTNITVVISLLLVTYILRAFQIMWAIDLIIILLAIVYICYCSYYERMCFIWIALGLSPLIFWDIRIIGSIMNRMIIEPSIGFSLLLGAGLSRQIRFSLTSIKPVITEYASVASSLINRSHLHRIAYAGLIIFSMVLGTYEEVTRLGMRQMIRDLRTWDEQGEGLRSTITYLTTNLPDQSTLILMDPSLSGMQITEQIANAMVLFDRPDIRIIYAMRNELPDSFGDIQSDTLRSSRVFLISGLPVDDVAFSESSVDYELVFSEKRAHFASYIYQINTTTI